MVPKVEADNTKRAAEQPTVAHPPQWNVQPHEVLAQVRQDRPRTPEAPHPIPIAPQQHQPLPHRIDATPHPVMPPPPIDSTAHTPQARLETTPRIAPQPQQIYHGQRPGHAESPSLGQNLHPSNAYGSNNHGDGHQHHDRSGSNYKPLFFGAALGAGGVAASNYYRRDRDSDSYGLYNGGAFNLGTYDQGSQFYAQPLYGDPGYGDYADRIYADGYGNPGYGAEIEVPPIFGDNIAGGITLDDGSYTEFRNSNFDDQIEVPPFLGSPPGIVDGYYNPQPYEYQRPYQNGPDILGQALPNIFGNIIGGIIGNAVRRPYEDEEW